MIYLISYPRSGNTMTRYLFELMTKKPSNGLCGTPNPKDILQKPLLHEGTDYCLHKRHDFKGVEVTDFVFFVIRDPLEAVIRHNERPRGLSDESMMGYLDSYFELLGQFHHHAHGMVLYYDEIQKVSSQVSRDIYPDSQSTHPDFHKYKIGKESVDRLTTYMKTRWSFLYHKYIR